MSFTYDQLKYFASITSHPAQGTVPRVMLVKVLQGRVRSNDVPKVDVESGLHFAEEVEITI